LADSSQYKRALDLSDHFTDLRNR